MSVGGVRVTIHDLKSARRTFLLMPFASGLVKMPAHVSESQHVGIT